MACYHPILAVQDLNPNENGKYPLILKGPYTPERAKAFESPLMIPCGKCIGCRLDYSRHWADRMMFELDHTGKGLFLTLTYNDKHIPYGMLDDNDMPISYSLEKSDLQKFWKRLRKKVDVELRYFACGEYGSHTYRPHYHACVFGVSLDDLPNKKLIGINKLGQPYYTDKLFEEAWSIYDRKNDYYDPIGYIVLSEISWKTCAYVARYVTKKVVVDTNEFNAWRNVAPEFILSSRNPGIGAYYISDHGLTFDSDVQKWIEGRKLEIPQFLLEKMRLTDPDGYDKLKEAHREFAENKMVLELQQTDLDFEDFLRVKEESKLFQSRKIGRDKN